MGITKIIPLLDCNICYEKRVVINCKNKLCDWNMCKNCLLKYGKTKCPACTNENSFKRIDDKCFKFKKRIKYFFNHIVNIFKNYFYRQYLIYNYIYDNYKSLLKEERKCPCILYVILILLLFSVGGSIIFNSLFFDNRVIKWVFFEWILYSFLGFLLIVSFISIVTIIYICVNPILN
jgi:cytochrome b subunit of formate dehydrogenase